MKFLFLCLKLNCFISLTIHLVIKKAWLNDLNRRMSKAVYALRTWVMAYVCGRIADVSWNHYGPCMGLVFLVGMEKHPLGTLFNATWSLFIYRGDCFLFIFKLGGVEVVSFLHETSPASCHIFLCRPITTYSTYFFARFAAQNDTCYTSNFIYPRDWKKLWLRVNSLHTEIISSTYY